MDRRRPVLGSIVFAAAFAAAPTSQTKPSGPVHLAVGKTTHAHLTKDDPTTTGAGRFKSFDFVAAEDGECTVDASAPAFDVMVIVKDGTGVDLPGLPFPNEDRGPGDGERITFPVVKGETYLIVVVATFEEVGDFDVAVTKGAAPASTVTASLDADVAFFKKAFAFANDHKAPARAARVAWQVAYAAVQLGQSDVAEEWLGSATAALEKATACLDADELELQRLHLEMVAGEIAQARGAWDEAARRFDAMERRCDQAARTLDARQVPAEDRQRLAFAALRRVALAGQTDVGIARDETATALVAARKLRQTETAEPAPPGEAPTTIQCALLFLLDATGHDAEATQLEADCAARIAKCSDPPIAVVLQYSRFLVGRARYAEAIDRLRAALGRADAAGDDPAVAELCGELCAALVELGNYAEADQMARRMLRAAEACGNAVAQARALLACSVTKRQELLYAPARADAERARQLLIKAKAESRVIDASIALCDVDISEGKLDDAMKRLAELERHDLADPTPGRPRARSVRLRIQLGYTLQQKAMAGAGDLELAAAAYQAALQQAEALHDRHLTAIARTNLGDVARLKGDHARARDLSSQAIEELRALCRFDDVQFPLLTIGRSALTTKELGLARAKLAEAEELLHHRTAVAMVGTAAALLRVHVSAWGEIAQELTTLEIAAASDDAKRAELVQEGCRAACRWKTRALLAGIVDHARLREAGGSRLADQLREQLALQDRHSAMLNAAYENPGAAGDVDGARKRLRDAEARSRDLEAKLRAAVPPRVEDDVPTLEELRKSVIGPDTVLVEFANGSDDLYAYAIDAEKLRRFDLGPRKKIEALADAYLTLISDTDHPPAPASIAKSGAELYASLLRQPLEGVSKSATRLLVAPTTALGALPFDALVVNVDAPKSGQQRFTDIHYVLERWTVATLPSGAVACELARLKPRGEGGAWLLVGAPREPDAVASASAKSGPNEPRDEKRPDDRLRAPFRGMSEEVLAVARGLARGSEEPAQVIGLERALTGHLDATAFNLYLGVDANRDALVGDLSRFAVLHFACHGDFDPGDPRNTALRLAPMQGDLGRLSVLDVLDLELDANVTVLSACSTARGHRIDGDGEQSLARAFLVAGSRSVIATLWPVDDLKVSEMMRDFFSSVGAAAAAPASNVDFAAELAKAKQAARRTATRASNPGTGLVAGAGGGDDTSPTFWAGVVYFGIGPKQ